MTKTAKQRVTFELVERDTQDGSAKWNILVNGEVFGDIEKSTARDGVGYVADSYTVCVETGDDDDDYDGEVIKVFDVRNIWNRHAKLTARQALAAAKDVARHVLTAKPAHMKL
jgi:hypothetical protein